MRQRKTVIKPAASKPRSEKAAAGVKEQKNAATKKLGFKEQRELETLPAKIESLETEIAALQATMNEASFYQQEKTAINAAQLRWQQLQTELKQTYERWQELDL